MEEYCEYSVFLQQALFVSGYVLGGHSNQENIWSVCRVPSSHFRQVANETPVNENVCAVNTHEILRRIFGVYSFKTLFFVSLSISLSCRLYTSSLLVYCLGTNHRDQSFCKLYQVVFLPLNTQHSQGYKKNVGRVCVFVRLWMYLFCLLGTTPRRLWTCSSSSRTLFAEPLL